MAAIPNQQFKQRDPGLAQTPPAINAFLCLGTASGGVVNSMYSFNDLPTAADTFLQGPLAETMTSVLSLAGGPQFGMRLTPDVLGTIGAVTKRPKGSSTGTIAITVTPQDASKAWQIGTPAGTPTYTDFTAAFASAATADVTFFPTSEATGDQFAIGFTSPFSKVSLTLSTAGVGGTVTWKYWNGTAWTALSGAAGTGLNLTATGTVTWTMPTDWKPLSINGSASLYFVVAEVATTYSTNPIGTSGFIDLYGPHDSYDVDIGVLTTGTLGAGTFDYSLDGNYERSPELTIPSGGVYDIPNTGLRVTFTPGGGPTFFEAGDNFSFATVAPSFSTTSLASAFSAIGLGSDDFAAIVLAGRPASSSAGATLFATLATQLTTLELAHRPCGAIMDTGVDSPATTKTSYASSASPRIMPVYTEDSSAGADQCHVTSAKPFNGWAAPRRSAVNAVAPRAAASLISTHLGRFADGTLANVRSIGYNEEKGTAAMSVAKFCTLRTWTGFPGGFYINRPNIKSAAGSDFELWPHRRMADTAHRTAHRSLQRFMNSKIRVRTDGVNAGKILDKEALRIEGEVNAALAQNLTVPDDAEGHQGHLAAVAYRVNREWNVASTNQVVGLVVMVRDGYAEEIITTLGFAATAV
jgi:hypothetical protein